MIYFHKGGKVGIKGGKSLCSRPFVLHDPQEIYHLVAQHG